MHSSGSGDPGSERFIEKQTEGFVARHVPVQPAAAPAVREPGYRSLMRISRIRRAGLDQPGYFYWVSMVHFHPYPTFRATVMWGKREYLYTRSSPVFRGTPSIFFH